VARYNLPNRRPWDLMASPRNNLRHCRISIFLFALAAEFFYYLAAMKSSKPVVAVLKTSPATVLEDYHRLMNLADYQSFLPKTSETALKINIWIL